MYSTVQSGHEAEIKKMVKSRHVAEIKRMVRFSCVQYSQGMQFKSREWLGLVVNSTVRA